MAKRQAKPEILKAVLYARFSPQPRAKKGVEISKEETIAFQLTRCRDYCSAMGYEVILEEWDEYASGGSTDDRPGLASALTTAKAHQAVLVVFSLSRLARNTVDAGRILEDLHKAKAHLAMLDLRVDTSMPHGELVFKIMSAIYEFDRKSKAAYTKSAMLAHQANGRRMSDICPYGWKDDPDSPLTAEGKHTRMIEDPDEQATIQTVVALHEDGLGLRAIARRLDTLGVPARQGKGRWYHQLVKSVLVRQGLLDR